MSESKPVAGMLEVKGGDLAGTVSAFLADLLGKNVISAVLAPRRVPAGDMAFPALMSDPKELKADPFAPVLPVSTATLVQKLTREGPISSRVAVVMRNCQIRALVELVKLKQADIENIIVIGVDCPGTFSIVDYKNLSRDRDSTDLYLSLLKEDKELTKNLRSACIACREPVPQNCDILVGSFGVDAGKALYLESRTPAGEEILKNMSLKESPHTEAREKAVQEVLKKKAAKEADFLEIHADKKGIKAILDFYSSCINCQNCRRVCPICYCQECFFTSDSLVRNGDTLIGKSRARGAFKMPLDTLLFHTGRMNHMILSCVECGLCEQACPVEIPLMQVLKRVAGDAQAKFDYRPGRSLEEEIPLKVFQEKEFSEMGGE